MSDSESYEEVEVEEEVTDEEEFEEIEVEEEVTESEQEEIVDEIKNQEEIKSNSSSGASTPILISKELVNNEIVKTPTQLQKHFPAPAAKIVETKLEMPAELPKSPAKIPTTIEKSPAKLLTPEQEIIEIKENSEKFPTFVKTNVVKEAKIAAPAEPAKQKVLTFEIPLLYENKSKIKKPDYEDLPAKVRKLQRKFYEMNLLRQEC